jgi:hypothetical protein
VGFDVLTTCQPSTVLPAAAAQPAKVRQSCSATDYYYYYYYYLMDGLNFFTPEFLDVGYLLLLSSTESMILLGSIQRLELIKLIERHIGRERRLQVAAKWQKEAQERSEDY